MTTTIETETLFFGPGTIEVDGVSLGQSEEAAKATFEIPIWAPKFQGRGTIKGTEITSPPSCKLEATIEELSAARAAWAFPGASAVASACVGTPIAGLSTTLAADPALGVTNLKVASVTTVNPGDFIRVSPAAAAEADSEIVKVLVVGTVGGGGTGLDIVNDVGGGMTIDHANAETVKTVLGTTLAAPAAAGGTTIKVASVTDWAAAMKVRLGYAGQYESRTVVSVGTAGSGGTGITLDVPLNHAHAVAEWVIEVDGLGTTTITPAAGVIPASAYHTVVLRAPGVDGVDRVLTLRNARGVITGALTFDAEKMVGVPLAFETTYDPADLEAIPFDLALA